MNNGWGFLLLPLKFFTITHLGFSTETTTRLNE